MTDTSSNSGEGSEPERSGLNSSEVRGWAQEAGFAEAGLVALPHAADERDAARFEEWVGAGNAGSMRYLERRSEEGRLLRSRVAIPFPWARSAVVCFAGYNSGAQLSTEPAGAGAGWIARYAWSSRKDADGRRRPSDYHKVLKKRLESLEARIRGERIRDGRPGEFEARGYVDTGPVVERSLATAAGLGWIGKNTCLIHPKLGSFGFLAVLLTSLPVHEEKLVTLHPDRCGTCRRCIEACPTEALVGPYKMDATRCISYLTIEHKGTIAEELMAGMGRQVFGCDICQDVCPWNRRTPIAADAELEARSELVNPALEWLGEMDEAEFERQFNGSPVRRAGFDGLRRNVATAMGDSGQTRFAPFLEQWGVAADEGLRSAARWALARIETYGK